MMKRWASRMQESPARQRVLLSIAVVLALAVIFNLAWRGFTAKMGSIDQQIALKELKYEKFSRILAQGGKYKKLNASLKKFQENLEDNNFIRYETPSLSEVHFQNLIKKMASESKVDIKTTKVLPRTTRNGLNLIKIRITARAEIGSIIDFMLKVQKNDKYIFFREFQIQKISRREARFYNFNAVLVAIS